MVESRVYSMADWTESWTAHELVDHLDLKLDSYSVDNLVE